MQRLPRRALTNIDIMNYTKYIPYFRGVYMRNNLPAVPFLKECAIFNLDSLENPGTHWVAYVKLYDYIEYFDSYGNLKPCKEFLKYMRCYSVYYNYSDLQKENPYNCGHLCIRFLENFWRKHKTNI